MLLSWRGVLLLDPPDDVHARLAGDLLHFVGDLLLVVMDGQLVEQHMKVHLASSVLGAGVLKIKWLIL